MIYTDKHIRLSDCRDFLVLQLTYHDIVQHIYACGYQALERYRQGKFKDSSVKNTVFLI
jgi:hypothetical protein